MQRRYLHADYIFDGLGQKYKDHTLIIEDEYILYLCPTDHISSDLIESYQGGLCPGFINAHCHLELSHLIGLIPEHTGLITFLKSVVGLRSVSQEVILQRIAEEDQAMTKNGIVAVADICNTSNTALVKKESPIRYYSLMEAFDLFDAVQMPTLWATLALAFSEIPDPKSYSPHAPYSVSKDLWDQLNHHTSSNHVLSIHCQEMPQENELHRHGSSEMDDFLSTFGLKYPSYARGWKSSLDYILNHLDHSGHILFVHCTQSTIEDFEQMKQYKFQPFLVTCPNANLYIENTLPNYTAWLSSGLPIAVGTDSLSSNHELSILSELKAIRVAHPKISTSTLISWGCNNGARALHFDDLGSFSPEKRPGVNLLQHLTSDGEIGKGTTVRKLI